MCLNLACLRALALASPPAWDAHRLPLPVAAPLSLLGLSLPTPPRKAYPDHSVYSSALKLIPVTLPWTLCTAFTAIIVVSIYLL